MPTLLVDRYQISNLLDEASDEIKKGNKQNAVDLYVKMLRQCPENVKANLGLANLAFADHQFELAYQFVKVLLELNVSDIDEPECVDITVLLVHMKRYDDVVFFVEKIRLQQCLGYNLCFNAGMACKWKRDFKQALYYFSQAAEIEQNVRLMSLIAEAYVRLFQPAEALRYLNAAENMDVQDGYLYEVYGSVYSSLGDIDKAEQSFLKSIALDKNSINAYAGLTNIKRFGENVDDFITKIHRLIDSDVLRHKNVKTAYFTLANLYDHKKQYDKAFECFTKANQLHDERVLYNADKLKHKIERIKKVFTRNSFIKKKSFGHQSAIPIFVVGMPRSGTTLIEQILSSHSLVCGAGELPYIGEMALSLTPRKIDNMFTPVGFPEIIWYMKRKEVNQLAQTYLNQIVQHVDVPSKLVDKMPENFIYIGLISFLFPRATIIHSKRHPLDVCLSLYCNNFMYLDYAFDFGDIASYYKCYAQLMNYWHEQFPGRIYDNYYEELLYNQEQKSKDLIARCGLKWEKQCLSFQDHKRAVHTSSHWQVRQKLYKGSMQRYKKYEKHMAPLKEMLAIEIAEYEKQLALRLDE